MTPLQVFRRRMFLYEQEFILVKRAHPENVKALEVIDENTERCIREYVHEQGREPESHAA